MKKVTDGTQGRLLLTLGGRYGPTCENVVNGRHVYVGQSSRHRREGLHDDFSRSSSEIALSRTYEVFAMNLLHPHRAWKQAVVWILLQMSGKYLAETNVLVLLPSINVLGGQPNGTGYEGFVPLAEALGTVVTLADHHLKENISQMGTGIRISVSRSDREPTWAIADTCRALMNKNESTVTVSANRTYHRDSSGYVLVGAYDP